MRLTKRLDDGQLVMDCRNCELNSLQKCTALACRNRLKERLAECEDNTIDAVPVVRCKDCKHYEPCEGGKDFCCFHATGIVATDFCSYGERKDGEG